MLSSARIVFEEPLAWECRAPLVPLVPLVPLTGTAEGIAGNRRRREESSASALVADVEAGEGRKQAGRVVREWRLEEGDGKYNQWMVGGRADVG